MVEPNEQDEDALYRRAEQELDDGSRDMDLWRRACGMASQDHDEARFLYQTLRVEQWLADGINAPEGDAARRRAGASASGPPDERQADAELGPTPDTRDVDPPDVGPRSVEDLTDGIETRHDEADPASGDTASVDRPVASPPDGRRADARLGPEAPPHDPDPPDEGPDDVDDLREGIALDERVELTADSARAEPDATVAGVRDPLEAESRLPPVESPVAAAARPAARDRLSEVTSADGRPDRAAGRADAGRPIGSPVIRAARERRGRRYLVLRRGRTEFEAAREGASWPAAFCTLPWLLWHGLVGTALSYALLWIVLAGGLLIVALTALDRPGPLSVPLQALVIGYVLIALAGLLYVPLRHANGWYRRRLERQGYEPLRPVQAVDRRDAVEQVRRAQRA